MVSRTTDERVEILEWHLRGLAARVELLERPQVAGSAVRATPGARVSARNADAPRLVERESPTPAAPGQPPTEPESATPFAWAGFEDLLGGRVLAWVGGFTVLMGVVLLFALAVSQGWIGETARTLLATGGSLLLLATGVFLHERRGRTDAARAAVATAVAALFATVTVAAQVYELVDGLTAYGLAAAIGAGGTWLALRWDARGIAALGILGAVGAPLLVGAPDDLGTLALLLVAVAAGTGVLLYRRWSWLGVAVIGLGAVQWVPGVLATNSLGAALLVLVAFGLLGSLTAVAFELRGAEADLRLPAAVLLTFQALVVTSTGWLSFGEQLLRPGLAEGWVAAVAGAHLLLGLVALARASGSRDLALLSLAIGVLLADLAFGLLASGPLLAVGWAASAVLFAVVLRRSDGHGHDAALANAGLGGHVALSLGHVLLGDASPLGLLGDPVDLAPALIALAGLAAGCFASARFTAVGHPGWRSLLDVLGLVVVAYSAALAFDGLALVGAWTIEGVLLVRIARTRADRVAEAGGLTHIAAGVAHVLLLDAPLRALVDGRAEVGGALLAIALVVAGCLAARRSMAAPLVFDRCEGDCVLSFAPAARRRAVATAALDLTAIGLAAYGAALALDGAPLVAVWALGALALAAVAGVAGPPDRVIDDQDIADGLATPGLDQHPGIGELPGDIEEMDHGMSHLAWAALGLFGMAAVHVVSIEAPPLSLYSGLAHVGQASMAMAALIASALAGARLLPEWRRPALAVAAAATLFLMSSLLVSGFQPEPEAVGALELGARQQGQALLSALWATAGVAALVLGLKRDLRPVRVAGLVLLLITIAKVFAYDLAALTSFYRVASVVALGLLLLIGAYAWQRARPRAPEDLRLVPPALR